MGGMSAKKVTPYEQIDESHIVDPCPICTYEGVAIEDTTEEVTNGGMSAFCMNCGVRAYAGRTVPEAIAYWESFCRMIGEGADAMIGNANDVSEGRCAHCGNVTQKVVNSSLGFPSLRCDVCGVSGPAGVDRTEAVRRWRMFNTDASYARQGGQANGPHDHGRTDD